MKYVDNLAKQVYKSNLIFFVRIVLKKILEILILQEKENCIILCFLIVNIITSLCAALLSYCGSVDVEKKHFALDELFSVIYRDRAIAQRQNYRVTR